jgi:hypothetical protein
LGQPRHGEGVVDELHILQRVQRKSLVLLIFLVSWEVWRERNARVFRNVATLPIIIVAKIRAEAALWSLAGAKNLGSIMPRE